MITTFIVPYNRRNPPTAPTLNQRNIRYREVFSEGFIRSFQHLFDRLSRRLSSGMIHMECLFLLKVE